MTRSSSSACGLWKTVKDEEVYLKAYDSMAESRAKLSAYIRCDNGRQPHRALGGKAPGATYFVVLPSAIRDAA